MWEYNMRRIIFILLFIGAAITAKCDTIDFWHVYYNKTKKIECTIPDYCTFVFLRDSVKVDDSITVLYFMDTRCYDCMQTLSVKDNEGKIIYTVSAEEERPSQRLVIPVSVFIESRLKEFNIYYKRDEKYKEERILKISMN
jgi:hypothetical protein